MYLLLIMNLVTGIVTNVPNLKDEQTCLKVQTALQKQPEAYHLDDKLKKTIDYKFICVKV